MTNRHQLLVFGDQAVPYFAELQRLLGKKDDHTLIAFLLESYRALKAELSRLPPSQQAHLPRSSNLTELLIAQSATQTPSFALDSAFAVLHQLATFVSYANETRITYPQASSSCLVGRCIGLLSALAISCSASILDLVSIGPEIVILAFRLGLLVQSKSNSIVPASDRPTSRSSVVGGIDEKAASQLIDSHCGREALPAWNRIYISAVSNGNVTISGPPTQLEKFFSQHPKLKIANVRVHGLFHCSGLYNDSDLQALVGGISKRLLNKVAWLSIVSNADGPEEVLPGTTCADLLKIVLQQILIQRLRWDAVIHRCCNFVKISKASEIHMLNFATGGVQALTVAIRTSAGARDVQVFDSASPWPKERESRDEIDSERMKDRSKIAIIGFSGRYPEADDNEAFWQLLASGLDVHKEIPKDRFDPVKYFDPTGKKKNTSGVTKGCFIKQPDLFDSRFFGMSAREAEQADPAQRLALMTAYEAMEMAGFVPDATSSTQRERVGVFYGTASDDYRETNAVQDIDTYFVPGGSRAFLPARINYHFRFSGPSFDVDTACSSGLAAIHIACNSLWLDDCDVAIAGGTNILTNPDNWAGLDRAHFLSHTGNCNTFDDAADGYCRAESVATVLLKRLEDAQLDGDPVYGTILGAYTNHSAEAVSMTRPHSGAQRAIFSRILTSANVPSSEVSYVEMHGTGTQHGDLCEMDSVLNVFAPEGTRRDQSLYLGSAKANIGHGESASGVSSLIKVLLMMEKEQIPRHVGIKTRINRNFPTDLAQRNVHIPLLTASWPRPDPRENPQGRRAFVNNFGAAGGNSSVLLEDGPMQLSPYAPMQRCSDPRPLHVVCVTAKTQTSLKRNIVALRTYLIDHAETMIGSLSFTTTARRSHYGFRAAVIGSTITDICNALQEAEAKDKYISRTSDAGNAVGFCFAGQGSQYLGMGRKLLEIPQFRCLVISLQDVACMQGYEPILPIIDGSCQISMEALAPATLQLAITCLQMALGKFWISLGVSPQLVIGHSLGEYAALNIANVLSDADTIHLVGTRAMLLENHCTAGTHAMLAIRASSAKVTSLITSKPGLEIVCVNGAEETVIGGTIDEIQAFANKLAQFSIKGTQLKVQFAFHSAQVEPMIEAFRESCRSTVFNEPSVPVLSPLLRRCARSASDFGDPADYLARHCRKTVDFYETLQSAKRKGDISEKMLWVEIGAHPVCTNMLKSALGSSIKVFPTLRRGEDDWAVFVPTITSLYKAGLQISWNEYHSVFADNLRVLRLPAYQWDLKSYWIPYKHDWCLTKGDPPVVCNHPALPPPDVKLAQRWLSTSVQDIVDENYSSTQALITARTDLQHPDLAAVLLGHRVNGRPVCSSAVYADMAATLFSRMLQKSPVVFDKSNLGVEVSNMVADKSLILGDEPSQLLELKAHVTWSTMEASFTVYGISKDGSPIAHHANCTGSYSSKTKWTTEWGRRSHLVHSRIAQLQRAVHDDDGSVHLIKTGMYYKLFSSLVEYSPSFKGCLEAILKSEDLETTAKVKFNTPPGEGEKWMFPPYWLDSLGQITGFTMNANDAVDSKNQVFINHGWENMRIAEQLSQDVTYRTYLKMQKKDETSYIGDVYIFKTRSDKIIAMYEGVTFSAVQRKILDMVLPAANKAGTKNVLPVAPVAPTVPIPLPVVLEHHLISEEIPAIEPSVLLNLENADLSADKVRQLIAEEVCAPVGEVTDDVELMDLGFDSLLALTMSDRLLEEFGLKIDSTVFITGLKVKDIVQMVTGVPPPPSDSTPSTPPGEMPIIDNPPLRDEEFDTPLTDFSEHGSDTEQKQIQVPSYNETPTQSALQRNPTVPKAPSVLLQGNPATCTRTLWLFPDGSGLATSYLHLPDIDATDVAVYGLSSPFIKKPKAMAQCRFEDLTASYLHEVRRRQPHGPYNLGGWSAGGISAYDAAQNLVAAGESVERLILLDTPSPIGLAKLPSRLYDEFNRMNVFGTDGRSPPAWLFPHLLGFLDILDTYVPRPWACSEKPLRTVAIVARDGVDEEGLIEIRPEDPPNMTWLLRGRKDADLELIGWDQILGRDNLSVEVIEGVHHFNILKEPSVERLGILVQKAMGY